MLSDVKNTGSKTELNNSQQKETQAASLNRIKPTSIIKEKMTSSGGNGSGSEGGLKRLSRPTSKEGGNVVAFSHKFLNTTIL